ncbi:MAG: molybdopterin-dependent oxidoreductase [Acidobacteriota bacterium]|nr:molybdopterin-dependent oxidoreductase [Acidobacteriota bacterium]
MNEDKKQNQPTEIESKILVEKVREIESAKQKAENSDAQNSDRDNTAKILNEKRELSEPLEEAEAKRRMSQKSRRGFLIGGATALVGVFGWRWMPDETKQNLLRRTFEFNERISQIFYTPKRLAPEFPRELAGERVNGMEGLSEDFNAADWRLRVGGLAGRNEDLILTLDDIKALPRTEMTTELKCIEGWSVIVNWTGARFSDFMAKYQPRTVVSNLHDVNNPNNLPPYVSLVTPDEGYYVGWDMPSILHPQTLLAYEMNGAPLTPEHGAPLRLATATKYGIKQIKRIGRIEFTLERPADYWAERGYDWYAGH